MFLVFYLPKAEHRHRADSDSQKIIRKAQERPEHILNPPSKPDHRNRRAKHVIASTTRPMQKRQGFTIQVG